MAFSFEDTFAHSGFVWVAWAILLTTTIYLASLAAAFTTTKKFGEHHWISVGPFFAWFVGAMATVLMILQLQDVAAILSRLAQLSGAADLMAKAHATAFVALVIVLTARAFFVISEMDAGRYAGGDDLPTALAKSKQLRWWEACIRLSIIASLTVFAGAFVQVVIPVSGQDLAVAGTPFVLAEIRQMCAEYADLIQTIDHGSSISTCVAEQLASLPPEKLRLLANNLVKPMPYLLGLCYVLMLTWSIVVWRGALHLTSNTNVIRKALLHQCLIAVTAFWNLVVMLYWISVSTSGEVPFIPNPTQDAIAGSLMVLSTIGFGLSALGFCLLTFRLWNDLKSFRTNLAAAIKDTPLAKRWSL